MLNEAILKNLTNSQRLRFVSAYIGFFMPWLPDEERAALTVQTIDNLNLK